MDIFFFVPINKIHKLKEISNHEKIDEVIIELEENAPDISLSELIDVLKAIPSVEKHWIRPKLRQTFEDRISTKELQALIKMGFRKFLLPKVITLDEVEVLERIFENYNDFELIYLVEHPYFLYETLPKINPSKYMGLGLGLHDFLSVTGSAHTKENYKFLKQEVLFRAKVHGKYVLDSPCMETNNRANIIEQLTQAFQIGYDAQLYIHPKQLEYITFNQLLTQEEIEKAQKIIDLIEQNGGVTIFKPQLFESQIIERPHYNQAKKIINIFTKWK